MSLIFQEQKTIQALETFSYDKRIPTYDSEQNLTRVDYEKPVGNNIAVMLLTYSIYGHFLTASITGANVATLTRTYDSDNFTIANEVFS